MTSEAPAQSQRYWPLGFLADGTRVLVVVCALALGTVGSFGAGFGIMTDCTNNYSCTETGCDPCAAASRWITIGAVVQGLVLLAGIALLLPPAKRLTRAVLASGAALLLAASIGGFAATTHAASNAYCQPGETDAGPGEDYCDVD